MINKLKYKKYQYYLNGNMNAGCFSNCDCKKQCESEFNKHPIYYPTCKTHCDDIKAKKNNISWNCQYPYDAFFKGICDSNKVIAEAHEEAFPPPPEPSFDPNTGTGSTDGTRDFSGDNWRDTTMGTDSTVQQAGMDKTLLIVGALLVGGMLFMKKPKKRKKRR